MTEALVTDYVTFPTDLKVPVCLDIVAGTYWFEVLCSPERKSFKNLI